MNSSETKKQLDIFNRLTYTDPQFFISVQILSLWIGLNLIIP